MGIAYTRNHALQNVSGDYMTFLDGDDRFLPRKLEKEMETLLITPEAHMVFSNFYSINSRGQRIWIWDERMSVPQGDIFLSTFAIDFPRNIHFRNELVNLRAWRDIGNYDCRLKIYEDYDMRIRFSKKYQATYNREPSVEYRRYEGGLSSLKVDYHLDALRYLFKKNIPLLYDIDEKDRRWLLKRIGSNYINMLKTNASAAIEKNPGSFKARMGAVRNYFISLKYQTNLPDLRLLPRVILPSATLRTFMNCYSRVKLKYRKT
jgi:glycosyltransferase involved in cell wall biosynthesis